MATWALKEIGKWQIGSGVSLGGTPDRSINIVATNTPYDLWVQYKHSGETGPEALVRVQCDPASGTCKEVDMCCNCDDGVAYWHVKVLPKPSDGRFRFVGYGQVGGTCSYQGLVAELETKSTQCTCDGAANCNLTSNTGPGVYDPRSDYVITGGHCGGKWAWVLKRSDLSIVGRFSESQERTFDAGGNIYINPMLGTTKVLVTLGRTYTRGQYFRIGIVDLDEVLSKLSQTPNVDEMDSWQELYKTTQYTHECIPMWTPVPMSDGSFYVLTRIHTSSGTQVLSVGPFKIGASTQPSVRTFNCSEPHVIGYGRFACTSGKTIYIYGVDGTTVATINVPEGDYVSNTFPYVAAHDTANHVGYLYVITVDGAAPIPVAEQEGRIGLFDVAAGKTSEGPVMYGYSPFAVGHGFQYRLPVPSDVAGYVDGESPVDYAPPDSTNVVLYVWPRVYSE